MNELTFTDKAFDDYIFWQRQDKKTLRKINALMNDIKRNGAMQGTGKPERLKHGSGYSRRIDDANRLVYEIDEQQNIRILSCKGHHED